MVVVNIPLKFLKIEIMFYSARNIFSSKNIKIGSKSFDGQGISFNACTFLS